jgi:hypothetical protein
MAEAGRAGERMDARAQSQARLASHWLACRRMPARLSLEAQ